MNRGLLFLLVVGISCLLFVTLAYLASAETNDDSFITFRYAENLVHGHGLVFNPGERVEGYTNFLWTMVIAAGITWFDPVVYAKILGILFSVLLLVFLGCDRQVNRQFWWFPVIYCALDPGLVRWSVRGLETSLFAILCWLTFWFYLRSTEKKEYAVGVGLSGALAALTRPDGLLFLGLCTIAATLHSRIKRVEILKIAVAGLTILLPYALWKFWYYGTLVPNTFYAKTGGGIMQAWRGFVYICNAWNAVEFTMIVLLVLGIFHPNSRKTVFLPGTTVLVYLFYLILVGGDSLGPDRFLVPITPFLAFCVAHVAATLSEQFTKYHLTTIMALVLGILIVGNGVPFFQLMKTPDVYSSQKEQNHPRTRLGKCLGSIANSGDSVATSLIGRVPYYSKMYTYDVFGLIDPHIARKKSATIGLGAAGHEKTDIEYILEQRPTFIISPEPIISAPPEEKWMIGLRKKLFPNASDEPFPMFTNLSQWGYSRIKLHCPSYPVRVGIWKRKTE